LAKLYGNKLSDADLHGADLFRTHLHGADLSGAILADSSEVEAAKKRLAEVKSLKGATMPNGQK
jgi:uncharacterized protein YjbI with pentapeptide repeats